MKFVDIVQHLTIEADFTRLGGSVLCSAPEYGYNMEKTEDFMISVVKGLLGGRKRITMAEFNLMGRRYEGSRPIDTCDTEPKNGLCSTILLSVLAIGC